jgi:hypothetical protein
LNKIRKVDSMKKFACLMLGALALCWTLAGCGKKVDSATEKAVADAQAAANAATAQAAAATEKAVAEAQAAVAAASEQAAAAAESAKVMAADANADAAAAAAEAQKAVAGAMNQAGGMAVPAPDAAPVVPPPPAQ